MAYETSARREARHEKKRLRLAQLSGRTDLICSESDCAKSDIRVLEWSVIDGLVLCATCIKRRLGIRTQSQARKLRSLRQLGYEDPACIVCGENDPCTLELHHVAARSNCSLEAPHCANCHAIASDMQNDFPIDLRRSDTKKRALVLQAAFEFGLSILLTALALREQASESASRYLAFMALAAMLVAWALWNVAADGHFANTYGEDYDTGVPARVPS